MLVASNYVIAKEVRQLLENFEIDTKKLSEDDWLPETYNVDVDNDGELEFITNGMHGDGVMFTNISKIIDGKAYYDKIYGYDLFKDVEFPGISISPVLYYPGKIFF